ncbi:MAG: nucleotidyl transferase AbiEii/AbiGii toxin family protein [Anaerolineales bacterium]
MQALTFWKTVAMDRENQLEEILAFLHDNHVQYCVVGGQAVNAYVEPLVSLDLDLAVAISQLEQVESLLATKYHVERFPHSLNVTLPRSDLRVQIQTDPRYGEFVEGAEQREILGLTMPVAQLQDVLRGKIWAAQDADRRGSKRQKDLADIARILESYPDLRPQVPAHVLARLI